MAGPCAKQVVHAIIVTKDGESFEGTNFCHKPQSECPRGDMPSGVGYELCVSVCNQPAHAEVNAIRAAGEKARGATLYLHGHERVCDDCHQVCQQAGIEMIVMGEAA